MIPFAGRFPRIRRVLSPRKRGRGRFVAPVRKVKPTENIRHGPHRRFFERNAGLRIRSRKDARRDRSAVHCLFRVTIMNPTVSQAYVLAGADARGRRANAPESNEYRSDVLYERLTVLKYSEPASFLRMAKIGRAIAAKFPEDPSATAFGAYCEALSSDWSSAVSLMKKTIALENGRNLDSWIDLGHFLRKIPGMEGESRQILLDPVSKVSSSR